MEKYVSINYDDEIAIDRIKDQLSDYFKHDKILIACIGTDKLIGDSLGPIVGTILQRNDFKYPVMGDIKNNINGVTIHEYIEKITNNYNDHFIIGIDAALSWEHDIGKISISDKPVRPASGMGRKLPSIGNASINGITMGDDDYIIGFADSIDMNSSRLSFVMEMAEVIATALIELSEEVKH